MNSAATLLAATRRNRLEWIVLSEGTKIAGLWCQRNKLEDLELAFPELSYVDCSDNNISYLDLSRTPKLRTLKCNNNQIEALDCCSCGDLQVLKCDERVHLTKKLSQHLIR